MGSVLRAYRPVRSALSDTAGKKRESLVCTEDACASDGTHQGAWAWRAWTWPDSLCAGSSPGASVLRSPGAGSSCGDVCRGHHLVVGARATVSIERTGD